MMVSRKDWIQRSPLLFSQLPPQPGRSKTNFLHTQNVEGSLLEKYSLDSPSFLELTTRYGWWYSNICNNSKLVLENPMHAAFILLATKASSSRIILSQNTYSHPRLPWKFSPEDQDEDQDQRCHSKLAGGSYRKQVQTVFVYQHSLSLSYIRHMNMLLRCGEQCTCQHNQQFIQPHNDIIISVTMKPSLLEEAFASHKPSSVIKAATDPDFPKRRWAFALSCLNIFFELLERLKSMGAYSTANQTSQVKSSDS